MDAKYTKTILFTTYLYGCIIYGNIINIRIFAHTSEILHYMLLQYRCIRKDLERMLEHNLYTNARVNVYTLYCAYRFVGNIIKPLRKNYEPYRTDFSNINLNIIKYYALSRNHNARALC